LKDQHLFKHLKVYSNDHAIKEALISSHEKLVMCQSDVLRLAQILNEFYDICGTSDTKKLWEKKRNLIERRKRYRIKKQKEKQHLRSLCEVDNDDHFIDSYVSSTFNDLSVHSI